jgi:hypothetical protein
VRHPSLTDKDLTAMTYAVRNAQGQLTSLHRHDPGVGEPISADDPEVRAFLGLDAGGGAGDDWNPVAVADADADAVADTDAAGLATDDPGTSGFSRLDADFIRVLEDVIDALTSRNLINITDLPDIAQTKLFARKSFRERRPKNALDLFRPGDLDNVL